MTHAKDDRIGLTCFVSAAAQTDLGPILAALQSAGVSVKTAVDISSGRDIMTSLVDIVLGVDFVCVVVDGLYVNPNVAFEAGVAAGSRRPLVVVSSAPSDTLRGSPLSNMATIRYIKDAHGSENLSKSIKAFVQNVQPVAARLAIDWDDLALQVGSRREASLIRAVGLTRRIAERLMRAGALVSTDVDGRIDIVATFPSLGSTVDRVAVEVKSRFRNRVLHQQTERQLRHAMQTSGSLLGILVYGEPVKTELRYFEQQSLFDEICGGIIVTSADELDQWTDAELLDRLTRLRNTVIHGRR